MPIEPKPATFPLRYAWDPGLRGEGSLCLANCTNETFVIVRAKGSGKLRTSGLLAGTEIAEGTGFTYRLSEPGWRAALGPGQVLGLQARSGVCAGQALFSLQDPGGKALATLGYTMVQDGGTGPALGAMTLQSQGSAAPDLLLVTGGLPGNAFLVREAHLGALRRALDEYAQDHPEDPGPLSPAV